eukprot:6115478-Pleurochrysis_carterae.AAC.1
MVLPVSEAALSLMRPLSPSDSAPRLRDLLGHQHVRAVGRDTKFADLHLPARLVNRHVRDETARNARLEVGGRLRRRRRHLERRAHNLVGLALGQGERRFYPHG